MLMPPLGRMALSVLCETVILVGSLLALIWAKLCM